MGKTITPRYYARYRTQDGWHDILWNGRATDKRAEEKRRSLNASFQPGGVNEHVSIGAGYVLHVSALEVCRNISGGCVVARAKAPMFEVI